MASDKMGKKSQEPFSRDWKCSLLEAFQQWEKLTPVHKTSNVKKKFGKFISKKFRKQDEAPDSARGSEVDVQRISETKVILKALASLKKETGTSWAGMFHWRLLISNGLLGSVVHYVSTLARYIKLEQRRSHKEDKEQQTQDDGTFKVASELLAYLRSHKVDPDNASIGLSPSSKVKNLTKNSKKGSHIRVSVLKPGSLVIAQLNGSSKSEIFARIVEVDAIKNVATIYVSPFEQETKQVVFKELSPVTKEIFTKFADITKLEELVVSPVHLYFNKFSKKLDKKIDSLLTAKVDEELIHLLRSGGTTLYNLFQIRQCQKLLESLVANVPKDPLQELVLYTAKEEGEKEPETEKQKEKQKQALIEHSSDSSDTSSFSDSSDDESDGSSPLETFYREIEDFIRSEVSAHVKQYRDESELFSRREAAKARFRQAPQHFLGYAHERLKNLLENCEEALQRLSKEKEDMLTGKTKENLADWWLMLINDMCNNFLMEQDYDIDAIPHDYIVNPPADLEAARNNTKIVRNVLTQLDQDKEEVHVLIHDLTACILPKIDNFIDQVRIVLADIVGYSESSFDPVVAKKLCSTKKSELSEDLSEQLEMLLMDVDYLLEMKNMGEKPSSSSTEQNGGGFTLGVVPIHGLIAARFYALENECQTVLDLWDVAAEESEPPAQSQPDALPEQRSNTLSSEDQTHPKTDEDRFAEDLTYSSKSRADSTGLSSFDDSSEATSIATDTEPDEIELKDVFASDDQYSSPAPDKGIRRTGSRLSLRRRRKKSADKRRRTRQRPGSSASSPQQPRRGSRPRRFSLVLTVKEFAKKNKGEDASAQLENGAKLQGLAGDIDPASVDPEILRISLLLKPPCELLCMKPDRRLLWEGKLIIVDYKDPKKRSRQCFLFDDVLLITEKDGGGFCLKMWLSLQVGCQIEHILPANDSTPFPNRAIRFHAPQRSFLIYTRSKEDKEVLVEQMLSQTSVEPFIPETSPAPPPFPGIDLHEVTEEGKEGSPEQENDKGAKWRKSILTDSPRSRSSSDLELAGVPLKSSPSPRARVNTSRSQTSPSFQKTTPRRAGTVSDSDYRKPLPSPPSGKPSPRTPKASGASKSPIPSKSPRSTTSPRTPPKSPRKPLPSIPTKQAAASRKSVEVLDLSPKLQVLKSQSAT